MTSRALRRPRRTLEQAVERALRSRLLGSAEAGPSGTLPAAPTSDLFPRELEAALDRTVAEFHARPRNARNRTGEAVTEAAPRPPAPDS
ncbi:MAG: hypothetical protein FJY55_12420 [Betaproteobacteria bacterium]|nr:hypothetical protein [Betaproteobacteria bacterium]